MNRTAETTPVASTKRAHSIRDVSHILGVSQRHLGNEIRRGKLQVRHSGRRVIVLEEDLTRYLEQAKA